MFFSVKVSHERFNSITGRPPEVCHVDVARGSRPGR
jgi:hypothetical protein